MRLLSRLAVRLCVRLSVRAAIRLVVGLPSVGLLAMLAVWILSTLVAMLSRLGKEVITSLADRLYIQLTDAVMVNVP